MRYFKPLAIVAIGATAALAFYAPTHAQGVPECHILGNWSGWGRDGTGTFDVGPGGSCTIGASTFGKFEGSKVAKKPEHGSVKQLSVSRWQYTAAPGFTGSDSFVLEGIGHDPSQRPGQRSQVTMNVNVR